MLQLLDEPAAHAIAAGRCPPGYGCPADYPAETDRIAAGLFLQRLEAGLDPRPFGAFLVVLTGDATPTVIGGAGFHGGPDRTGRVEIGYGIAASRRGLGYATRALSLLIVRAGELGAQTLVAQTDPDNAASQAVLVRCGFVPSGGAAHEAPQFAYALSVA